jgi:hypothetical protein
MLATIRIKLLPSHTLSKNLKTEIYKTTSQSKSQSHIATDGQSVSKSWCRAPSGAHDQILITVWQLRSCFCGAPSLTRGRVCLLYMLLALAAAVFLGSESLRSRDHILLSLIRDFPFRRLLRLAGSRWRYSTPPPHRFIKLQFYNFVQLWNNFTWSFYIGGVWEQNAEENIRS